MTTLSSISKYLKHDLPNYEKCKLRIGEKDFFIPSYSEYYMLFKYNYTVPQMKSICRHYKLPRTGSKKVLEKILYNYLFYSHQAIKIQKYARGYLQRKLNKLRGPAFMNRKLCVNDCDFFTLEPVKNISHTQFYSFKDSDGFTYGFDILSLWQLFEKSSTIENPYNRNEIPPETKNILSKLIKLNKRKSTKINVTLADSNLNLEKELELRIVSLFQFINNLGHYTDHSWFISLSKSRLIHFYRELVDIWNHRAQISNEVKHKIYPYGNPFRMVTNYSLSHDSSLYDLRKFCVVACENLVFYGNTQDDKTLGAYYILSALTLQSHEAAVALPWLYQSVV